MTSRRIHSIGASLLSMAVLPLLVAVKSLQGHSPLEYAEPPKTPDATQPKAPEKARGRTTTTKDSAGNGAAVDPKWLERLPKEDREAVELILGATPASFTDKLKWIDGPGVTWADLRGKVVVMQSWTTATTAGRTWPNRVSTALNEFQPKDLRILALHTPEGAPNAEAFLKKQKPPTNVQVVIDPEGGFCDDVGVFKQPVNIVIDRQGTVRYVGLNPNGLKQVVAALVAEPFDPKQQPTTKETADKSQESKPADPQFPSFKEPVKYAEDIRGKRAPAFQIDDNKWLTTKPNATGKVVVIDFWATWCGPCVAAIPHMNELVERFGDKIVCVGISDESNDDFKYGLEKRNLKLSGFKYSLALDSKRRMYSAIKITAIPHCIVMSKDWIVRWQGNPHSLTAETLEKIIKANDAVVTTTSPTTTTAPARRRWTGNAE